MSEDVKEQIASNLKAMQRFRKVTDELEVQKNINTMGLGLGV